MASPRLRYYTRRCHRTEPGRRVGPTPQGLDRLGAGPMMAVPIDVRGAQQASQATGIVGPTPIFAPTQPNPATTAALRQLQVDAVPRWYAVRYTYGVEPPQWEVTPDPGVTAALLMRRAPVTRDAFVAAYRFSHTGAFATVGKPSVESGILTRRWSGSPQTGWTTDF